MKLTIVGPRSVGKSSLCKYISEKYNIKHFEMDKIIDQELIEYGGLENVMRSNQSDLIYKVAIPAIQEITKENIFILDIAGGSITKKNNYYCNKIINIVKENSIFVGLLPYSDDNRSVKFLLNRETKRNHFKEWAAKELKNKIIKNYQAVKIAVENYCSIISYVGNKSIDEITNNMMYKLNNLKK